MFQHFWFRVGSTILLWILTPGWPFKKYYSIIFLKKHFASNPHLIKTLVGKKVCMILTHELSKCGC